MLSIQCRNILCLDRLNGKIKWQLKNESKIYGRSIISGNYFYVEYCDYDKKYTGLLCMNTQTGNRIWDYKCTMSCDWCCNQFDLLPVILNNKIYHYFELNQTLVCLNALTGKSVWQHNIDDNHFSPIISGDKLKVICIWE